MSGKYKAVSTVDENGNKFKSKLEAYCHKKLEENGIDFGYETVSFILLEDFQHEFESWEIKTLKKEKVYSALAKKVSKIKYIPDFIGRDWLIETKGKRTPEFNLKWKLFKYYLHNNGLFYNLFLPTSQKQVDLSIKTILNN